MGRKESKLDLELFSGPRKKLQIIVAPVFLAAPQKRSKNYPTAISSANYENQQRLRQLTGIIKLLAS